MPLSKLKEASGVLDGKKSEKRDGDTPKQIDRDGILVHSGPEGEGVVYEALTGETKPFDKARIQRIVDNQNKLIDQLAESHGGFEKIPVGAFYPFKDAHDESGSSDKVMGRLTGRPRFEIRDVPNVGKNVACVVCKITFLGEENVQKVLDGRVYHLSVGIDEESDTLGETSSVVEPAAPGASLLGKVKKLSKGAIAVPTKKQLKASKERFAKLSSMRETLSKLSTNLEKSSELTKLAKAKDSIVGRLTKLSASRKITPAEFKKFKETQLSKLAAGSSEMIDAVLATYEGREPVVEAGQRGTTDAADFSSIGKSLEKRQRSKLKSQVRGEFTKMGVKLKADPDAEEGDKDLGAGGFPPKKEGEGEDKSDLGEGHPDLRAHLAKMQAHLAKGDLDSAKQCHAEMCAAYGGKDLGAGVPSEESEKSMASLQGELDEVKTQMARMSGMVDELMKSESDEGSEPEGEDANREQA